ncbi:uncharacterized protein SCHCODRAFT_02528830 [Schizophyllum commune H4-8]|uniref:Uncharacterized protein n=1 Tax=Schizophyllum commune (strain H4-8 / FGSC 9210) TaxID=578458 RepID=D8PRT7_SCHCM|nr:uncharacterized protein SCHCODRAFT_02528830 [Schizophyllum commune H4-8]KAI5897927.1 hypothetical protein SCHCODRAFT_02528830 [Schizophyllum commune H4-8]
MSIQTAPASTTFAASPENFGLKRSSNASPRSQNNQTMDPESLADSLAAFVLDGAKNQPQLASGANTIPLGSRSNKPPLKDVTNHLADAAPMAALPFSITGTKSGPSAIARKTIATHTIPTSAFITNPNAVVVRRSAFPPMQASARPPTRTFVNPYLPSNQASAPALQKPSTIASAFNCNPNAFAAAYNARVPHFNFNFNPSNPSPSTASAFGLPSTWSAVTNIQEDEPMDVDDPWAMEICLPDPDAMDTSPNSENYSVPFFPYHGPQEFVAPQFGRLFHPFVPPPLPEPTHANAYNALRQLDSSTAAMHASLARPELYSTSPRQLASSSLDESLLPRFSEPIMDELVQRYPHSPDAILADKKRKRTTIKTAAQREAEAKQARYCAQLKAERKELHRRSIALAARKPELPSKKLRTPQADRERVEVPPCMVPEKTRRTLAEMKKTSATKMTKTTEASRRCNLTKVGSRLLAAACSAPRSLVGFL